jgi:hypothetical protein
MDRLPLLLAIVAALAAGPATAHESGDRAMGVIESVTKERIVLKAADGHSVEFAVTPATQFFQGERPARLEDARQGQRAVVHGKRGGGGAEAVRVRLGALAPSPPPR